MPRREPNPTEIILTKTVDTVHNPDCSATQRSGNNESDPVSGKSSDPGSRQIPSVKLTFRNGWMEPEMSF
ncbi:hypothetical protein J6590_018921 [Homalodisca vitripennis]|nr:hypothetical protein J6590_018921 [Homalodisca vitripennis]